MSRSSIETDDCSGSSGSTSDYLEFTNAEGDSSLERSVSLPKRTSYDFACSENHSILDGDDSLWCTDYASDIFAYLRQIEGTRKSIMFKSPQISRRPGLVDLIKRIAEAEELGRTTVHLAVYLLDVFMDTYKIIASKLNLMTLVCLLIAAKVEERDQNIPKISILDSYVDDEYSRNDFKVLERMILNFFKWTLLAPTTATFVESFAHQTATYDELVNFKYPDESFESRTRVDENAIKELCANCNNLVFEFLDLTLSERRLVHIRPSLLSAACLAASRKVCAISPIWPERLELLTDCTFDMIDEYVEAIICLRESVYRTSFDKNKKTPDSGYITNSESDSHDDDDFTHCPIPFKRQRLTN